MPTNNYILTSNGSFVSTQELMNSRSIRYIDLDEGELIHWKYLKKEKVNGKWRYYYDLNELKSDLGVYKRQEYLDQQRKYRSISAKSKEASRAARNYLHNTKVRDWDLKTTHELLSTSNAYREVAEKRGRKYMEARSAYMNTPLGKTVELEESVKRGVKTVSNWFKKLANKLSR